MSMSAIDDTGRREAFNRLLGELRPKLHRYCARMAGSVIDGEDIVQESIIKALEAFPGSGFIENPESWLFRIAHNTALDFLRRRTRLDATSSTEDPDMVADPVTPTDDRTITAANLRTFMRLPVAQRSSVILMDVLGYSLAEIGGIMDSSIPALKAALHRGRARLREFAHEPDDQPLSILAEPERSLLARYIDRFNAHDFDAVRNMLADEVRLELVSQGRANPNKYFGNYSRMPDWRFEPGFVDGRPAALLLDTTSPSTPAVSFVLLEWSDSAVVRIRDFYHARYAIEGADIRIMSR